MSVERRVLDSGRVTWRVRWREGQSHRSRQFNLRGDAYAFEAEVRRRRRMGSLEMLEAGRETLADFAQEWWRVYAQPILAPKTLLVYADIWDRHVLPRLGGLSLRELSPRVVEGFQADLRAAGVGDPTIVKVMTLLQGVLQRAVIWQRVPSNPVTSIKKPRQRRSRVVRPLSPSCIEDVRALLLRSGGLRDATLVSVLAYAGLRPGEALALRWADVREQTLVIEKAVSMGIEKATKTGQTRTVRLLAPLSIDLAEWRLRCGRPHERELVFPAHDGGVWSDDDWRNWRRRVFAPAIRTAGLGAVPPYDLRHAFISLLIAEGASVVEVARQAGNSPTIALGTYAHVFEELSGADRRSSEAIIRAAREARVPILYPRTESEAG